jgi:hypothetical protein
MSREKCIYASIRLRVSCAARASGTWSAMSRARMMPKNARVVQSRRVPRFVYRMERARNGAVGTFE